jgi:TatD DNase family protein
MEPNPTAGDRFALIDTHAHLCDPAFDADRGDVLRRAEVAGVAAVVAVGESLADAERNLELAAEYPSIVRPAAGLFPTRLSLAEAQAVADLIRRERTRFVAIGEVGLDYWKVQEEGDRELQRQIFGGFVNLALELDLPLNIHSRAAGRPTIEFLLEHGAKRVQLHAFDGRAAKAMPAVEAGYYFSVPPSIVRSVQKQKLIRRLPLECLLLETDSPVLAATADERNEPSRLLQSLRAIAELKGLQLQSVAEAVTENTWRLYGEKVRPVHQGT